MPHQNARYDRLMNEYNLALNRAIANGYAIKRHPDVDTLDGDDEEDLRFLSDLIERISRAVGFYPAA